MKTKQQLQQIADSTTSAFEFVNKAKEALRDPDLTINKANYWIRKFGIETRFKRGRPAKVFE
jgi:hypothetical protein